MVPRGWRVAGSVTVMMLCDGDEVVVVEGGVNVGWKLGWWGGDDSGAEDMAVMAMRCLLSPSERRGCYHFGSLRSVMCRRRKL